MAWLAKNKHSVPLNYKKEETEVIFQFKPKRDEWGRWMGNIT